MLLATNNVRIPFLSQLVCVDFESFFAVLTIIRDGDLHLIVSNGEIAIVNQPRDFIHCGLPRLLMSAPSLVLSRVTQEPMI